MRSKPLWIEGGSRSGKTTRLVGAFREWVEARSQPQERVESHGDRALGPTPVVWAANENNRRKLADKLSLAVQGSHPVTCKTPLGFMSEEVALFFPLLVEALSLSVQFPLRLRPETEQELALQLWQRDWAAGDPDLSLPSESRFVRQTLDLLQLAGAGGVPCEDIALLLEQGASHRQPSPWDRIAPKLEPIWPQQRGEFLLAWRQWCLEQGFLTYGLIYELYWRYLLPNPQYQQYLLHRFWGILADDVDDCPAIAADVVAVFLDADRPCLLTYNPDGQIRLGLNADPHALVRLAERCEIEQLGQRAGLAKISIPSVLEVVFDATSLTVLPESIQSLQTVTRAQLLRQTAEYIIQSVRQGRINPQEIAIIAPGLDEIGRYTLIEILNRAGIGAIPLNEQRPLNSSAWVRSLLTLLALIYPGLGSYLGRDDVAEMLVVLSSAEGEPEPFPAIDPVRAGLLADYCYQVDRDRPSLQPYQGFTRWDRLGYRAAQSYDRIRHWIDQTQADEEAILSPLGILERILQFFIPNPRRLSADQWSALRELTESAHHFWEVDRRLRQKDSATYHPAIDTLARFIQLIRRGTVTANPRPLSPFQPPPAAVTLATIFQYRSLRTHHRWQFWLDAGSPLWQKGGAATLFAAPLFLRDSSARILTPEAEATSDRARLERILRDLMARTEERIILCHSDLSVQGTEQMGTLLPLVQSTAEIEIGEIAKGSES